MALTNKIPIRIVQTQDIHKTKKISIMLDLNHYETNTDPEIKLKNLKEQYVDMISRAKKLFYGKTHTDEKKYRDLPSSLYWNLGSLLKKFNESIKDDFEITNYTEAISRDFGLSKDYIFDLLTIVKYFKREEILDSVYFSYYRALKRKRKELVRLELFEQEKARLNRLGETKNLPGREQYKEELITIIHDNQK